MSFETVNILKIVMKKTEFYKTKKKKKKKNKKKNENNLKCVELFAFWMNNSTPASLERQVKSLFCGKNVLLVLTGISETILIGTNNKHFFSRRILLSLKRHILSRT